jgi:tRNA threonylcarbamoyladenosine biosynthesis protein TsaB
MSRSLHSRLVHSLIANVSVETYNRATPDSVSTEGLSASIIECFSILASLTSTNGPLILAIESSTRSGSVALYRGESELCYKSGDERESHSKTLLLNVENVLRESGHLLDEVDVFAVATGPGSFTGLRIGIATVKAFSAAVNRPCVGVPTLRAVAASAGASPRTLSLLPAGRGELFAQMFSVEGDGAVNELSRPVHLPLNRILEDVASFPFLRFAGEGAIERLKLIEEFGGNILGPVRVGSQLNEHDLTAPGWQIFDAEVLLSDYVARLAFYEYERGRLDDAATLSPVYVRPSDPELKLSTQEENRF